MRRAGEAGSRDGGVMRGGMLLVVLAAWPLAGGALASRLAAQERPDSGRLTLGEVVEGALATYPSLAAARANEEGAAAGVGQARAAWFPTLATAGQLVRFQKPMVVAPLHGFDLQHPPAFDRALVQGNLSLSYTLFDGGARHAGVKRAQALQAGAGAGVEATRMAVLGNVVGAYLQVRSTREVLDAQDRQVAALAEEHDRAAQLLAEGRAAQVAVLRAEAALSRARADSLSAASQVEVAERQLARLAGLAPERVRGAALDTVSLRGGVPTRAALLQQALASNPELAQERSRLAAARAAQSAARALWLPRFQLSGRYAEYGTTSGSYEGEWQGGVQLSYPLFTGGSRARAVERAGAEARAAGATVQAGELRIGDAVDRVVAALAAAHARVAALDQAVAQSEEVARIEKLALDAGAGVQTDYLTAEAELFRARASLTEARYAEISARVELARITGELSAAWLAENLESGT